MYLGEIRELAFGSSILCNSGRYDTIRWYEMYFVALDLIFLSTIEYS